MRFRLTTEDMLVLRDGRPFGDAGMFGGYSRKWPLEQTLTGMIRTAVGHGRGTDYFTFPENQTEILNVCLSHVVPFVHSENGWLPLAPVPADLLFARTAEEGTYAVSCSEYGALGHGEGTDIRNKDWLVPLPLLDGKTAREVPFFLRWDFFEMYLGGELRAGAMHDADRVGVTAPVSDLRMHTAIDRQSSTAKESSLYANTGVYLKCRVGNRLCDLAIDFDVTGCNEGEIPGEAYLGGERRRVALEISDTSYPECPGIFASQQFMKLVLTSHGDFKSWCPDWLRPDLSEDRISWIPIPECGCRIRLRSACVQGWEAVSGWDYVEKGPKPMKKLVRPGTVYLIEVDDSTRSQQVAEYFWGRHLTQAKPWGEPHREPNGYGQCMVAKAHVNATHQGERRC